jgi:hypothetical protein
VRVTLDAGPALEVTVEPDAVPVRDALVSIAVAPGGVLVYRAEPERDGLTE